MAVYAPTSAGNTLLTDFLAEASSLSANLSPVVICGDLNVTPQDATPYNPSRVNHFYRLLGGNFFRADTGVIATRPANRIDAVNRDGNILDHFFGAHVNFDMSSCMSSLVHGSDHHPIMTRISPVRRATDASIRYWSLNIKKLHDPAHRDAYVQAVETAIPALRSSIVASFPTDLSRSSSAASRQIAVNRLELAFVEALTDIASRTLGRKPIKLSSSRRPTATSEAYCLVRNELDVVYNNLLRYAGSSTDHPRVQDWLTRRDDLRSRLKNLDALDHLHAYREWIQSFCGLSVSQRLKILNRSMRRRSAAGSCLSSTPEALDSYRCHFEQQFTNNFGIAPFTSAPPAADRLSDLAVSTAAFPTSLVREKILASPPGKAAGLTGLRAELLHPIAEQIAPLLGSMFCVYMALSFVPSSWKRALLCPVPKKGDLSRIANYRPISLLEVTRKIFEMCLLQQLQDDTTLSREQGGFRPGRSTVDQVACLDRLVKHSASLGRRPHMAFLDIKAAYDSVPRGELWRRCEQAGMNNIMLATMRALFDHNSAQLTLSQRRSQPFALAAGVLQGSVLSPILYSIFLDPLVEALNHGPKITLPGNPDGINCLLYADDIAIVAQTPRELQRLLHLAELDSLSRGYRFSPGKCVVISPGKYRHHLYGSDLTRCKNFCYLGFVVRSSGLNFKSHVEARVKKANAYADRLHLAGARWKNFPAYVNVQLYAAFIRPGLEYGLTLIPPGHSSLRRIHRCQKRILCRFLGVDVIARNDIVEAISNCPSIPCRQTMLAHRRTCRLMTAWHREDHHEFALIYTLRGIDGPVFPNPTGFDPNLTPLTLRTILYVLPISESLAHRFEGHLPISTLRWLLRLRIGHGVFRLLLLWILRRWDILGPARQCLHCLQSFSLQSHVVRCSGMIPLLTARPGFTIPAIVLDRPEFVIEYLLTCLCRSEQTLVPGHIDFLSETIRHCLSLSFGETRA